MTREEWLSKAIEEFRPLFKQYDHDLPEKIMVSCGWPSVRARSGNNQRIGECWQPETNEDGVPHIFISPALDDTTRILDVLSHELIHAMGVRGHKQDFKLVAMQIGLEGKMTATHAGPELVDRMDKIHEKLGDYPHSKLNGESGKKQSTRLIKCYCENCGYIVRTTKKWLEIAAPTCTPCDQVMEVDW